jgi:hypothetical protein
VEGVTVDSKKNEWIRAERQALLKIWCRERDQPRLVGVVTVWPGRGFLLHRPDGFGHHLDPEHGPISLPCRCKGGHQVRPAAVLTFLQSGRKHARVVSGSKDLHPLD